MRRLAAWSAPDFAKSSKVELAAWMMWWAMNGAPSAAPCSALLMQHSHSRTAQPSNPYCVSLEKIPVKSTCPSPGERKRPARLIDRKSTRLNSSHANISYAVFCLKKKKKKFKTRMFVFKYLRKLDMLTWI